MALVKCRECGREVSDHAEVCPHCGIKSPKKKGHGCLLITGLMVAAIGVLLFGLAISGNDSTSATKQTDPHSTKATSLADTPTGSSQDSNSVVFIGNKGRFITTAIGCPNLDDMKAFVNDYSDAMVAKDSVGESNAIATAFQAGCQTFHSGDEGLVIDSKGFLEGFYRIRMDADGTAYWTTRESIAPIPGQSNNP